MRVIAACTAMALVAACGGAERSATLVDARTVAVVIQLPEPSPAGGTSLAEALAQRRSVRDYSAEPLTDGELSDLLWAAQGLTSPDGKRTAPSAGALYPLETYVVTADGLSRYEPRGHRLEVLSDIDLRAALARVALGQEAVVSGAAVFVIAAVYERTAGKYGDRAERYVHLEAGHAAQNLLLMAAALGLGAVPIGAFDDDGVQTVLGLPDDHRPLYLIPVGNR
jgi:SagB-type dehydrogenase family enzyme